MRSSITNARSFPSADFGSDHQLVLVNIKLKLKAKKRPTQQMKNFYLNLDHQKPNSSLKLPLEENLKLSFMIQRPTWM